MSENKRLTNAEFNDILPKETQELYRIINMDNRTSTKVLLPKFGKVDFSKISVKQAEYFIRQKATFIELKVKTKPEPNPKVDPKSEPKPSK